MSVSILVPDELTRYSRDHKIIQIEADSVGTALSSLFNLYPDLQKRLVDQNLHFYPYLPAFLNDEKLATQGTWDRHLNDGDRLVFMVIASGG